MEKVLRRSLLNRNQLVTKKRRESAKDLRKTWRDYNRIKNLQNTELQRIVKSERQARREDWILGPLAPRRNTGANKETFGAVDGVLAQVLTLPQRERRGPRGAGYDVVGSEDKRLPGFEDGEWKGEGLMGNIAVGDRVVVVKGRVGVKGRIGDVTRVEKKGDLVFVKGVNKVDMIVPAYGRATTGGREIYEQELPIHINDLRLVTQMTDPNTGLLKDVIVRVVVGKGPYQQRTDGSNLPRHTRYIKGGVDGSNADIPIPWPEEDPNRFYTQASDTTRDNVETVTFVPSILHETPLSEGMIDELRNKHSRVRREWDDEELMRKKLLEDARRDWFAQRSKVLSQPFWTKEFMQREKKDIEARNQVVAEI